MVTKFFHGIHFFFKYFSACREDYASVESYLQKLLLGMLCNILRLDG